MNTYRVTLLVEQDGFAKQDVEIVKAVRAMNSTKAAENAMLLVKTQNPGVNPARIWASAQEKIFSSLVAKKLFESTQTEME